MPKREIVGYNWIIERLSLMLHKYHISHQTESTKHSRALQRKFSLYRAQKVNVAVYSVYRARKVNEGKFSLYRAGKVNEGKLSLYRAGKVNIEKFSVYRVGKVNEEKSVITELSR